MSWGTDPPRLDPVIYNEHTEDRRRTSTAPRAGCLFREVVQGRPLVQLGIGLRPTLGDALARLLRLDEITAVQVPTLEQETARDLLRGEDVRGDLIRARARQLGRLVNDAHTTGRPFSILVMRLAAESNDRPASDLTARARIRDAAIECFAEEGFDTGLRTIAVRAGVSPGLITHHFGSKAALRAACDAEVLRQYRVVKSDGVARPSAHLLEALTAPGMSATILVYLLRAILAGGRSAKDFLDHLMDDARPAMAEGVAVGLVRPSRDEEARLRYLTYQTLGALVVQFVTMPPGTPEQFVASLRAGQQDTILPILELFTEGLLVDRRVLDDYLQFRAAPLHGAAPPQPDSPHPAG